ncbi:MAG: ATP-binding cassette domain-containing protein, partial [Actinomycetota bacterium]|nr:ATP-binding cassette domain-containing protein [Actinomycetota bacterium]
MAAVTPIPVPSRAGSAAKPDAADLRVKAEAKDFNFHYGTFHALRSLNIPIHEKRVTALIGPSGCGKSTILRSVNRLNDLIDSVRVAGDMLLNGDSIYGSGVDVIELRKRMGMVFQKPNPFPMTIYENVALGPKMHYGTKGKALDEAVEQALHEAA